jgi:hypothetical protein
VSGHAAIRWTSHGIRWNEARTCLIRRVRSVEMAVARGLRTSFTSLSGQSSMSRMTSVLLVAIVCVPAAASADGVWGPGCRVDCWENYRPRFDRNPHQGMLGFSVGVSKLATSGGAIAGCDDCDHSAGAELDVHYGVLTSTRLALLVRLPRTCCLLGHDGTSSRARHAAGVSLRAPVGVRPSRKINPGRVRPSVGFVLPVRMVTRRRACPAVRIVR